MNVAVDSITFDFPAGWDVVKYDDWSFYRNQFGVGRRGIKAVDVLAIDPQSTLWFIEVKDYRRSRRSKASSLADEVARKVHDTLAALLPAKLGANDAAEQMFARAALSVSRVKVVLHLEQPVRHSKIFPRTINPANVQMELRRLLKAVDAHLRVAERAVMGSLAWSVR